MTTHFKQPNPLFALLFLICFGASMLVLLVLFSPAEHSVHKLHANSALNLGLLEQRAHQLQSSRPPVGVQIVEQLATVHDWDVRYVRYSNFREMVGALMAGEIDAIADMVIDHIPDQSIRFSRSYDKGQPLLVYFPGVSKKRTSLDNLPADSLLVINNSWQKRYLVRQQLVYPQLSWQEVPEFFLLQGLIESIATQPGGYTLVLEREFPTLAFTNPRLQRLTHLEEVDLGFAFRQEDVGLALLFGEAIDAWLQRNASPENRRAMPSVSGIELRYFLRRMETRLPAYIDMMVEAGEEFYLDWRLIAAIAYQESHWDRDAVSPTGVRGLMMLTNATAASLGVTDRVDPRQSIFGGTRYFLFLRDRIPERIQEPHRSWFALAAYNVGFAHVEEVRVYTQRQGGDPDNWDEVSANLHILEDPNWYPYSKYGYARGREARNYVASVRKYFELLLHLQQNRQYQQKPEEGARNLAEAGSEPLRLPEQIMARF